MDSYILVYGLPDKSDSPYIEYCTTAGRTTRIHMDPTSPANVVVTLPSKSGTLATMADVPSPTSDVVCHTVSTSGYIKSPVVSVASDGAPGVTSITRPANDSNWMLTLPNKSGTIALLDDIKGGGGAVVAVVGGTGIKVTGTTENPVVNIDTEVVAAVGHNHIVADVTGLATTLAGKADATHAHLINDVTGLQTALNTKAPSTHSHNTSDVAGLGSMATVNTPTSDGKTYGMKDGQWADIVSISQYDYSLSIDESFGSLANWTQKAGTWTAANGICSIVGAPASSNYLQYNTSVDCSVWFAIEADFKITSAGAWGGAGIAITDSNIAVPYKLAFTLTNHASAGTGIFGIVNAGASWIYTSTNKYWSNDTWVRMRVVVGMDRVVYVYINNVLVERVPVTSGDFKIPLTPFVSIHAGDCTLNIKNLKVWDLSYKTVPRTVVRVSDVAGLPEGLSYSANETLTGGTWVDGKPIYRKVIDTGALPGNALKSVASGITSLGWLISIQGTATSATDAVPIPYCDPTGVQNNIQLGFKRTDGTISVRTGSSWWVDGGFTKSQVIMEYTKA